MAKACATLSEFLTQAPEFSTIGPVSTGTLEVAVQPIAGDTFTISTPPGVFPAVVETYEAGVDFAIGATRGDTAQNIVDALNAVSTLVDAGPQASAVFTMASKATGSLTLYTLTASDPASIVFATPTLEGGDAIVSFQLACACSQINLECWGIKADCAHVYLTGHFLALQTGIGEGGVLNRKKIDKIEAGFQVSAPSDGDLGSTKWGRMYLQLRKSLFIAPLPGRRILPVIC